MGCLFAVFAGLFPRLAVFIIWLARPVMFTNAFGGSWLIPVLGILLLPFTTLIYVMVWSPSTGVHGGDWFWLAIAVVLDISGAIGAGYSRRYNNTPPPVV